MNCTCRKCGANFTSKLALAFFAFSNIFCFSTYGQNCNNKLSIEVIDLHDGSSLDNANISFEEIDIGGKTDQNGIIVFENLYGFVSNFIFEITAVFFLKRLLTFII